jgi:CheY-like chemotaxis protein
MSRVILVVDDEPLVLDVTVTMLEDLGHEVIAASSAKEALFKLAAEQRIDVLITDISMPGMDGIALARAATPMRDDLKVIIISGNADITYGFHAVRKPFNLEDLRRTMATI